MRSGVILVWTIGDLEAYDSPYIHFIFLFFLILYEFNKGCWIKQHLETWSGRISNCHQSAHIFLIYANFTELGMQFWLVRICQSSKLNTRPVLFLICILASLMESYTDGKRIGWIIPSAACHILKCSCASLLLMESLGRSWDAISRALASTPFIRSLQAFIVFRNNGGCDLQRLNEMLIPNYCHTNALLELSGLEVNKILPNVESCSQIGVISFQLLSLRMEAIVEGSKYECLLFDLDDTLYPFSAGINLACRKNIQDYMRHHLQIEDSQIADMCLELYKEYGTTMAGLKALGYEFDNDEFHANVHGTLPYDNLRLDPVLRTLLLSIPQRKIIFTNSDKAHAEEVLRRLGLQDCFEGIICFETLNPPALTCNGPHKPPSSFSDELSSDLDDPDELDGFRPKSPILCKPSIEAMAAAIRIVNADPEKTIFFDDSVRNIASGKAAGLHTVIVGRPTLVPGADHALESIHNIKEALPEIWDGWSESDTVLASAAAETAVVA